jgi:hypothetical protein
MRLAYGRPRGHPALNAAALIAKRANAIRRVYRDGLESVVDAPLDTGAPSDLTVYTFSHQKHVPEQVASIRSLLRHHGVPRRVTVVSDGSHTPEAKRLIERVHPVVSVVDHREVTRSDLPDPIARFIASNPIGAKLAMEWSIEIDGPTLYSDADVLFFPGMAGLPATGDGTPRFLEDFDTRFLDARMLEGDHERVPPTNSGLQLLFRRLEWDDALARFEAAVDPRSLVPERYGNTEQTVVHLAMRSSGGKPLPRENFVLEVDDEHDWRDRYGGDAIALRHYCYSEEVQRKLWLNVWDDLAAVARSSPTAGARALFAAALEWRADRRRTAA